MGGSASILEPLGPPSPPRCAAASGVLDPTAFYACIKYCSNYLRGGQDCPKPRPSGAYVGAMLGLGSYQTCFLHSFQSFFGHGAMIAARKPCWHSLSAFHNHPAARRYVRSTRNNSSTLNSSTLFASPGHRPLFHPFSRLRPLLIVPPLAIA